MTPKTSSILWWPPPPPKKKKKKKKKNIHTNFMPQKVLIFLKITQNTEIHSFEPKKMVGAYVCIEI